MFDGSVETPEHENEMTPPTDLVQKRFNDSYEGYQIIGPGSSVYNTGKD